jgi:hypothetical protein
MPARSVPLEFPGTVYFAHESTVWTGGVSFCDPEGEGVVRARAHLVTAGQFADIAAQEMHRLPGHDLDLGAVLAAGGRAELGPGRYETLISPCTLEGLPVFTFTAPWSLADTVWTKPSARYLHHIAAGLAETEAWDGPSIAAYLAERPGAAGAWTKEQITELLRDAVDNTAR